MNIQNIKINRILKAFFLLFISVVCITVNSKNSFLYSFQDSWDIHQFVTTIRCMKRGDVLYRDIFEVKGPILYFIYYLASLLHENPFHGVYFIELVTFSAYVFMNYKIASLYLKSDVMKLAAVTVSAYYSTITINFFGGGQCEELMLPLFASIIYIALKYIKSEYPNRIRFRNVFAIGALFGVVFWVKYAHTGMVLGLVLYIIVVSVKNKHSIDILLYAFEFLLGFAVVTGAVFIYFIYHNALSSLFEVYFYDMIFLYKPENETTQGLITAENINNLFVPSLLTAFALIFFITDPGKKMKLSERAMLIVLYLSQAFGISLTRVWRYPPEAMHSFEVFGFIGLVYIICENKELLLRAVRALLNAISRFIECGIEKVPWLILAEFLLLLLAFGDNINLVAGEQAVTFLLTVLLIKPANSFYLLICEKSGSVRKAAAAKYAVLISAYIIFRLFRGVHLTNLLEKAVFYTALITVIYDIYKNHESIFDHLKTLGKRLSKSSLSRVFTIVITLAVMIEFVSVTIENSPVSLDMSSEADSYAPYVISRYIKDSGVEDPLIINYCLLETGVYWLTDTFPPEKYISSYGFDAKTGIYNYKEKYIDTCKADFIVVKDYIKIKGYTCVYSLSRDFIFVTENPDTESTKRISLFVKDPIAEENGWASIDEEISEISKREFAVQQVTGG